MDQSPADYTVAELRKLLERHATVDVWPTTGKALGMSKTASYRAAGSDIPAFRVGRRLKVPSQWLAERIFGKQVA